MAPSAAVASTVTALPFWARGPILPQPGEAYAMLYFYVADPADVPDDFNFSDFFDFRALGADFAVETRQLRRTPSPQETPFKVHMSATSPLTFWFIPVASLPQQPQFFQDITMGELRAMDGILVGHSTRFVEELHPTNSSAPQGILHANGAGELENGGSFRFSLTNPINLNRDGFEGTFQLTLKN